MRTVAILPVKRFELAKQRLGAALEPEQRRRLARAMVGDVLLTLAAAERLAGTLVITNEADVARLAVAHGATVVADTAEQGQSAAAELGLARALADGYERALLVPGDCPALDPAELAELLAPEPRAPAVTIVPDRHGTGTNALLLNPPDAMPPSFGPGSFARHLELARTSGAACSVARPASLLLDVDTAEDLDALREALAAGARAPGTRALLERLVAAAR